MPQTEPFMPPYSRPRPSGAGYDKFLVEETRAGRDGSRAAAGSVDAEALDLMKLLSRAGARDYEKVALTLRVRAAEPTSRQLADGVERPNEKARERARLCLTDLCDFSLTPDRIAASVEGGVFLMYRHSNGRRLEIEADNDGDLVGVLSDAERVIRSEMIDDPVKTSRLVRDFRYPQTPELRRSPEAVG